MEKIENDKNMVVLKPVGNVKSLGYTAVFMDLSQQKCRINIIGNRQNSAMSLFITSKTEAGTKYTRLGQADKKSYIFDKSSISGTITGAVIGRADSKGALSMRYLEGSLKSMEASKNIYVKGVSSAEKSPDEPKAEEVEKKQTENFKEPKITEPAPESTSVSEEKPSTDSAVKPDDKKITQSSNVTSNISPIKKASPPSNSTIKAIKVNVPQSVRAKNVSPDNESKVKNALSENEIKAKNTTSDNESKNVPSDNKAKTYSPTSNELSAEDTFKKILNDFSVQMKKLESMGVINSDEAAEIQTSGAGKQKGKQKNNLFSTNEKIFPFDNSSFDWVKGTLDDLWIMGCNPSKLYNSFVLSGECKNGYIIIGCPFDRSCVVIGVPYEYNENDSTKARDAGFVDFWKSYCSKNDTDKTDGDFGYWIMNM